MINTLETDNNSLSLKLSQVSCLKVQLEGMLEKRQVDQQLVFYRYWLFMEDIIGAVIIKSYSEPNRLLDIKEITTPLKTFKSLTISMLQYQQIIINHSSINILDLDFDNIETLEGILKNFKSFLHPHSAHLEFDSSFKHSFCNVLIQKDLDNWILFFEKLINLIKLTIISENNRLVFFRISDCIYRMGETHQDFYRHWLLKLSISATSETELTEIIDSPLLSLFKFSFDVNALETINKTRFLWFKKPQVDIFQIAQGAKGFIKSLMEKTCEANLSFAQKYTELSIIHESMNRASVFDESLTSAVESHSNQESQTQTVLFY